MPRQPSHAAHRERRAQSHGKEQATRRARHHVCLSPPPTTSHRPRDAVPIRTRADALGSPHAHTRHGPTTPADRRRRRMGPPSRTAVLQRGPTLCRSPPEGGEVAMAEDPNAPCRPRGAHESCREEGRPTGGFRVAVGRGRIRRRGFDYE